MMKTEADIRQHLADLVWVLDTKPGEVNAALVSAVLEGQDRIRQAIDALVWVLEGPGSYADKVAAIRVLRERASSGQSKRHKYAR